MFCTWLCCLLVIFLYLQYLQLRLARPVPHPHIAYNCAKETNCKSHSPMKSASMRPPPATKVVYLTAGGPFVISMLVGASSCMFCAPRQEIGRSVRFLRTGSVARNKVQLQICVSPRVWELWFIIRTRGLEVNLLCFAVLSML